MADWQEGGFGLYIHWPFCEAKCPYCDFNSHVAAKIDHSAWLTAYLSELTRAAEETQGRTLQSVFFGGGTPSLMKPETTARILEAVRAHWPTANDIEITLEANPSSVEAGRFRAFRDAGISRVSMGIQALSNGDLRRLGRLHTVEEARKAYDIARTCFDRTSFDLIYARQDQTLEDWRTELAEALTWGSDHLSLYQLTVEPGTAFGARHKAGGLKGLPDEDLSADLYDLTQELTDKAGLPAYEISNHSADLAQSRHNLIYWRGGDFIGIGPGAHGRLTLDGHRYATETLLAPQKWLDAVATSGTGESARTPITAQEQAEEYLMMSLRLSEGSDLARFERIMGHPIPQTKIDHLGDLGLIEQNANRIMATQVGRPVLNGLLRELLT
ncbi:radical SAM family heme chaperone HemW [Gymnodinialimonas hymeniacidonis]|uniref:radical SAM family heme chaperone HemW n=1 Tax=Gymnodinialimonas hymeniacidonis TaxID=3126508 RepID=UPI0034C67350